MTVAGRTATLLLFFIILAPARASAQMPLTLEEAMERARTNSAEARVQVSAAAEADARVRQAQAGFWPRVDVSETVQRGNQPVFAFSSLLAQRRFAEDDFAIPRLNHPDPLTNTRTAVSVAQSVFDAGLTALRVHSARLGRDLAATTQVDVRQDLALRAAHAFIAVLQLEAAARAADAAVEAAESDGRRARARRDVGLVTEADVLAIDVHLADMRQRRIAAAGDLAVARLRLAETIGLPMETTVVAVRPLVRSTAGDQEALVREALNAHPQRRQADLRQQLADTARRTAQAGLLPTVGLQAGWEFNGATLGDQRSSWLVGAEVHLNVFRGFADRARIAEVTHAAAGAAADRERVERRIEVDVRAALAQLAAARAREDAGRAALAQARESQRIIRDRYENGLATVTDVLRAAEATLAAESRATTAEMDVILQAVVLDRALGRL